jgi:hypothetical protein
MRASLLTQRILCGLHQFATTPYFTKAMPGWARSGEESQRGTAVLTSEVSGRSRDAVEAM